MNAPILAGAALALLVFLGRARAATPAAASELKLTHSQQVMADMIVKIARELGVSPQLALTTSWLESRFNPAANGDIGWAKKFPDRFKKYVTDNPRFAANPARADADKWHSYGLFGLLAPHFTGPTEHPHLLYDPDRNARRGITYLRTQLANHKGDHKQARLGYAGALTSNTSAAARAAILDRWMAALALFEGYE